MGNTIGSCVKAFGFDIIGIVTDVANGIIVPCILSIKQPKRHWWVLIGNGLLIVFQLISMFTKNIGLGLITANGLLISIIFSIDVLIMEILYYLYSGILKSNKES